jgi:hypothetical protein
LSTTRTPCPPSSTNDRIRAVPINPQPPVMSQFKKTPPRCDRTRRFYSEVHFHPLVSVQRRVYHSPTAGPVRVRVATRRVRDGISEK